MNHREVLEHLLAGYELVGESQVMWLDGEQLWCQFTGSDRPPQKVHIWKEFKIAQARLRKV